jgi:hypothetical protein
LLPELIDILEHHKPTYTKLPQQAPSECGLKPWLLARFCSERVRRLCATGVRILGDGGRALPIKPGATYDPSARVVDGPLSRIVARQVRVSGWPQLLAGHRAVHFFCEGMTWGQRTPADIQKLTNDL